MAETVTQLLQARADDDNLAITYEGRQWTWREYIRDAEQAASAILGIAVQPPRDPAALTRNPLGIFVTSINWSKELG